MFLQTTLLFVKISIVFIDYDLRFSRKSMYNQVLSSIID